MNINDGQGDTLTIHALRQEWAVNLVILKEKTEDQLLQLQVVMF